MTHLSVYWIRFEFYTQCLARQQTRPHRFCNMKLFLVVQVGSLVPAWEWELLAGRVNDRQFSFLILKSTFLAEVLESLLKDHL